MSRPATVAALAGGLSAALLAAGHAAAGQPAWAVIAGCTAGAWVLAATTRLPGAPLACLGVTLALAVGGLSAGGPAPLLGLGAAMGVAAWDLALLARGWARDGAPADPGPLLRARSLALAAGLAPGLALAAVLGTLQARMPLLVVLAAGAVLLRALYAVARAGWRSEVGR